MHAARQTNSNASQQAGHFVGCMAKFGRQSTDCPVRDEHGRDLPQPRSMRWIERLAQHQVCDFLSDLRRACSELGSNVCALKLHVSKKTIPVDGFGTKLSRRSAERRPRNFRPDCLQLPSKSARQTNYKTTQQAGHFVGRGAKFGRKSTDCKTSPVHRWGRR